MKLLKLIPFLLLSANCLASSKAMTLTEAYGAQTPPNKIFQVRSKNSFQIYNDEAATKTYNVKCTFCFPDKKICNTKDNFVEVKSKKLYTSFFDSFVNMSYGQLGNHYYIASTEVVGFPESKTESQGAVVVSY